MKKFYNIKDLINSLELEVINLSSSRAYQRIYSSETNRPGLQLAGYYSKFMPSRLQIIGNAEWQYLRDMSSENRRESVKKLLAADIPAIIFTSGNPICKEVYEEAIKRDVTVLKSEDTTGKVISDIYNFSETIMAPSTEMHGVLVEVFGKGVLITGESGIGKSETGLDLIVKGHKLISDDIVYITRQHKRIIGTSPELTRHFIEIRGVGILDIQRMYGVSSVKETQKIDLIIHLEEWDNKKEYDRLGFDEHYEEILDVRVPLITLPMRPGRNTAMVIEVATRNIIQKNLGYNAAKALDKRVQEMIEKRKRENNGE